MTLFKLVDRTEDLQDVGDVIAEIGCIKPKKITEIFMLDDDEGPPADSGFELMDKVLRANVHSPDLEEYRQKARVGSEDCWTMRANKFVCHQGRLIIPDEFEGQHLRTQIIAEAHCRVATGHPGKTKSRKLVSSRYWWPRMHGDVDRYVDNCPCRPSKVPRDKTPGLLHPMPIPLRTGQHLAMDFKTQPKDQHGFDNIFVVIDYLSKVPWSTPCYSTATARDAAKMFYEGPYRWLGVPREIHTDRGPQFVADFTNELSKILGFKINLASAGHYIGQVEIMNEYLDQRLRPYVNHY